MNIATVGVSTLGPPARTLADPAVEPDEFRAELDHELDDHEPVDRVDPSDQTSEQAQPPLVVSPPMQVDRAVVAAHAEVRDAVATTTTSPKPGEAAIEGTSAASSDPVSDPGELITPAPASGASSASELVASDRPRAPHDLIAGTAALVIEGHPGSAAEAAPRGRSQPSSLVATTPLEQAVHQLLDQLHANATVGLDSSDPDDHDDLLAPITPEATALLGTTAPAPTTAESVTARATQVAPIREPAPLPESANPSHVHLVLQDGPERVVVTVAVRGNAVNVHLRGGDDQITAALARNAGALDHAMRGHGLDLTEFHAERELDQQRRDDAREPERDDTNHEPFELQEIA
jgi:hypothetical protein